MTDARINRIQQLADDLADLTKDMTERRRELTEDLGVSLEEITDLMGARGVPDIRIPAAAKSGMRAYIERLFVERGAKVGDTDTAAVPDVIVWIRGALHPVQGVMSKTPEGLLKLGSAGQEGPNGPAILVDQVFAYEDVLSIATKNAISTAPKSSLFMGH